MDRIDIQIEVPRVKYDDLKNKEINDNLKEIKNSIKRARDIQKERFKNVERQIFTNSEMNSEETEKFCQVDSDAENLLKNAIDKWGLSARSYYKILKTARTIADIEESENINTAHLAEALRYRIKQE